MAEVMAAFQDASLSFKVLQPYCAATCMHASLDWAHMRPSVLWRHGCAAVMYTASEWGGALVRRAR